MIRLIKYLENIGFETANTNLSFLIELLLSDKYDKVFGMTEGEWNTFKTLANEEGIYINPCPQLF